MKKILSVASLVGGTALEILSAAIIYAGIEEVEKGNDTIGIALVCIGVTMFIAGFAIMRSRGEVKRKEKFTEEQKLLDQFNNFIEKYLPEDIRGTLAMKLYDILGYEIKELDEPAEPGNMK